MPAPTAESAPVTPLERPGNLKEMAYDTIKKQIIAGRLKQDAVYSANQFADSLGVSRSPVRDALLQLAAEGYLVFIEGRGFKVREFSRQEIEDIFETRAMIEAYVVVRLVDRLTGDDLRKMRKSLEQMAQFANAGDAAGFLDADKEFHMTLVRRYNNQRLVAIMDNLRNYISIFGLKAISHAGRVQDVIEEHTQIVKALHHKDKQKALRAMKDHLASTAKYLLNE